ncbi:MAG: NAD(P)/FAD-dependent oxidoreductase [Saprospiraceae bacterium]|nr:NAD(P)/FAD-dependent oxidoreductase [Saprospiraceae bacterium]
MSSSGDRPADHADVVIIGGGAAGFFAAANLGELCPAWKIVILEQGREVLQKVKISGGGRCNVTHACWEPAELVQYYPRGGKELLGPFHKFACGDTVAWFEDRGVPLKIEEDGRMFPESDDSGSIVNCLMKSCIKAGVKIQTSCKVVSVNIIDTGYELTTSKGNWKAARILMAAGSSNGMWKLLKEMGYGIVPPVPSLFTFHIHDKALHELMGLSVSNAVVKYPEHKIETTGPLLITHWGVSGPAVLKMSAIAARALHEKNYHFDIRITWAMGMTKSDIEGFRKSKGAATVGGQSPVNLPARLWKYLVSRADIAHDKRWADLDKEEMEKLFEVLTDDLRSIKGKSTFKEEFVTAGGVDLRQINFSTFESRLHPGLYFAGEVLDIDAVTGGFNFQAAWTGAYLASTAMAGHKNKKS